jgi:hypothetical protein
MEIAYKFGGETEIWPKEGCELFENTTMQSSRFSAFWYAVAMVLSIFATEVQVVVTQITHNS